MQEDQGLRMIQQFKLKYKDKIAVIVGTGATADNLEDINYNPDKHVLIGINRAICLSDKFEFIFYDNPMTYSAIKRFSDNTKYFLAPIFSMGKCNYNFDDEKVYHYVWAWNLPEILGRNHCLDENLLYISWGNVQSAIHFASKIGCKQVVFYGCDGGEIGGKMHSDKVLQVFGENRQPISKLVKDYASTQSKMKFLVKTLGLIMKG
jgi:hypothetical protein